MKHLKTLVPVFILAINSNLFSQEQLGLRTDNYSGVNSLMINPANFLGGAFRWDVNVAGIGVFGQTSYGYLYNTHPREALNRFPNMKSVRYFDAENFSTDDWLLADFYDSNRKKYYMGMVTVLGPSFAVKFKNDQTFGLFTSIRAASSSHDIPSSLNFYFWDRTPYYEEISVAPSNGAAMAWAELGLNYGKRFESPNGYFDLAASVKILQGFEGFFFDNKTRFNATQVPNDTTLVDSPHWVYGLTTTNASKYPDVNISQNGAGIALDLGMVYTIEGQYDTYEWKFGLSILDIGRIHFNKNAQMHEIKTDGQFAINKEEYLDMEHGEDAVRLLSYQAYGDSTASFQKGAFSIWMPGAISFQADYAVTSNVFINGMIIQRIPYQSAAVERGNFFAITPRFENRWYGISMPVSVYNWQAVNFGMAARIAFLSIGTENIRSFFRKRELTGVDFYIALKVNPFEPGMGSNNRGKKAKCFYF